MKPLLLFKETFVTFILSASLIPPFLFNFSGKLILTL